MLLRQKEAGQAGGAAVGRYKETPGDLGQVKGAERKEGGFEGESSGTVCRYSWEGNTQVRNWGSLEITFW